MRIFTGMRFPQRLPFSAVAFVELSMYAGTQSGYIICPRGGKFRGRRYILRDATFSVIFWLLFTIFHELFTEREREGLVLLFLWVARHIRQYQFMSSGCARGVIPSQVFFFPRAAQHICSFRMIIFPDCSKVAQRKLRSGETDSEPQDLNYSWISKTMRHRSWSEHEVIILARFCKYWLTRGLIIPQFKSLSTLADEGVAWTIVW